MNQDNIYPDEYELKEVCVNFIKRKVLNPFMQERGIFIVNGTAEDMASVLSCTVMDRGSINDLRNSAFHINTKSTLSGFVVNSTKNDFSLQNIYEKCRDDDSILFSKGYRLGGLIRVETQQGIKYKGRLDYIIRKPGRIQFLDKEETHCEFYMYEVDGSWRIEVDSSRANDGKEVQRLFTQITDKSTSTFSTLNIDYLSDPQTIEFFDALIAEGMPKSEWRFTDVKALTFRQGREAFADSDEETEIKEDDQADTDDVLLTGIKNAILEGKNLRDDIFVKKFEENGCIFTAMTLEFQHITQPIIIQLRAEFKGNPKIFEVSLVNSYKITGTSVTREPCVLSSQDNLHFRSIFWNNARILFESIIAKS